MKTAAPALVTHLNTARELLMADLYTFTLATGVVHRFTSADRAIVYGGNTFTPTALLKRTGTQCRVGISVDTLTITASGGSSLLLGGISLSAAAVRGDLDRAVVVLERVWLTDWSAAPIGGLNHFQGNVADVDVDRMEVRISIKSSLERFNIMMPRRVYQAGCPNALFDASCGLTKALYFQLGTITAGSTALRPVSNLTGLPAGWGNLGTVEFLTGACAGQKRTVSSNSGGAFQLISKLTSVPAVGDTFHAYPGCDKTLGTCANKFGNALKYRGQPYIPRPDSVL